MITILYQCDGCKRVFVSKSINPVCPNCDDRNEWPDFVKICELDIIN